VKDYTIFYGLLLAILFILSITKAKRIGARGERHVSRILNKLPESEYIVLNDLMIANEYGTSQIDHLVLSIYGIFVIETKNYSGMIYGGEKSEQWTKNMYGNKYSFRNPIKQNYGHIKALSEKLNIPTAMFTPIVVFTPRANLKGDFESTVIYSNELLGEIKYHNTIKFTKEKLNEFNEILSKSTMYDFSQKEDHVKEVKTKIKEKNILIRKGICPKCGGELKLRKGKYGTFYGCSNYPKCKFTLKD